jgi:hypothetical protein
MALNAKLELDVRFGARLRAGGGRLGCALEMPLFGILFKRHALQNPNGMFAVT